MPLLLYIHIVCVWEREREHERVSKQREGEGGRERKKADKGEVIPGLSILLCFCQLSSLLFVYHCANSPKFTLVL